MELSKRDDGLVILDVKMAEGNARMVLAQSWGRRESALDSSSTPFCHSPPPRRASAMKGYDGQNTTPS